MILVILSEAKDLRILGIVLGRWENTWVLRFAQDDKVKFFGA